MPSVISEVHLPDTAGYEIRWRAEEKRRFTAAAGNLIPVVQPIASHYID
jgi:hypothetical protein